MRKEIRFKYEGATARLVLWDGRNATVSNVFSLRRGQGHAHGLLKQITDYADCHGLDLVLEARRYGYSDGMSPDNGQLRRFYTKHGFVHVGENMMQRRSHKIHGA